MDDPGKPDEGAPRTAGPLSDAAMAIVKLMAGVRQGREVFTARTASLLAAPR